MAHNAIMKNVLMTLGLEPNPSPLVSVLRETIQNMYAALRTADEKTKQRIVDQIQHQLEDIKRMIQDPAINVSDILRTHVHMEGPFSIAQPFIQLLMSLTSSENRVEDVRHQAIELFYHILSVIKPAETDTHVNSDGFTLLIIAIANNAHIDVIRGLLDHGASPTKEVRKVTPLMIAASQGRVDILELLVDRNADIHQRDGDGRTALMYAAQNNHKDAVKWLVDFGSDVDLQNNSGATALMLASRSPNGNQETLRYLLNQGAETHLKNKNGRNVRKYASQEALALLSPHFSNSGNNNKNHKNGNQQEGGKRHRKTHHRRRALRKSVVRGRSKTHRRRR